MMKLHNFSLGNILANVSKISSCLLYLDLQLSHFVCFLYIKYIVLAPEQLSLKSRMWYQWRIQLSITL